MEAAIAVTRAEMARLSELGGLRNDPLRFPIEALSVHLEALHQLMADATFTIGSHVAAARQPPVVVDIAGLSRTAADRVVYELPGAVDRLVLQRSRHLMLLAAGGAVLLLVLGVACGWAWRGNWPGEALPGFTCADQPDGSRVCYEYVRPPAASRDPAKH
ncbi:MAG: hypothetical protein WA417_10630 [Stellaceae bacterium]